MINDEDRISELLARPSESLNVELKTWLDPRTDEGKVKLVKAIFAIRNRNGGNLIIGINDKTRIPNPYPYAEAVDELFHSDVIIGLVSRYADIPFEISVTIRERDNGRFPVIIIPEGVRIPAVVKRNITVDGGRELLQKDAVYFRTLNSNGTPSSAILSAADWPDLLEICFENREADIGRFLRRHLAGAGSKATTALLGITPDETLEEQASALIKNATALVSKAVVKRNSVDEHKKVEKFLTMCVGLVLAPRRSGALPTQDFMNKIASCNPRYTGWPIWSDTRQFSEPLDRAYVSDGAWQSLVVDLDGSWSQHYEYLRFDPQGKFYLRRVMQDDLSDRVDPLAVLDPILMIYRVAETLAVGISIARSLDWKAEDVAGFAFRWTGLDGRKLSPWANWSNSFGIHYSGQSHTSNIDSFVSVPVETPHSALAPYVYTAIAPLLALFDGYAPPQELVENCVRKMIERKMG